MATGNAGWADTAVIKTMSRIDLPATWIVPLEELLVGGVAFGGDRGISKVGFSMDHGQTWEAAELSDARSPYSWVLWTKGWLPPSAQPYTIMVRATDGEGMVQSEAEIRPFPDGAEGYHDRLFLVEEQEEPEATQEPG